MGESESIFDKPSVLLTMREQLAEWYLDRVNNFISLGGFAEYYGLTEPQALKLLELGKECHETPHPEA